jgi:hypothetical protein
VYTQNIKIFTINIINYLIIFIVLSHKNLFLIFIIIIQISRFTIPFYLFTTILITLQQFHSIPYEMQKDLYKFLFNKQLIFTSLELKKKNST